jgi:putative transposase
MPTNLNRKNIRLPSLNYTGMREYFVTTCCHKRKPLLAHKQNTLAILEQLKSSALRDSFSIHAYCAMPDHLHFLAAGNSESCRLIPFVKSFKQLTGHEFIQRTGEQLWQFKFHDHILRRSADIDGVAWYIWMNPVRKGLCVNPHDFPYSGSFTTLWQNQSPPANPWHPPTALP